jgi:tRNA1(Val) A37 N6-methylase TrmN6
MPGSGMNYRPMHPEPDQDLTDDAVLAGRLRLLQPRRGHRFGHDAILLAAATAAQPGEHAVELGAGVGAAGLALAHRMPGLRVTLAEIDPTLVALANDNAARNGLADRVAAIVADASNAPTLLAAGLAPGRAQHVLMNPPFNDPGSSRPSPDRARALAHVMTSTTLAWSRTAASLLESQGTVTLIWRADGLINVLDALDGVGAVTVLPVHPRADTPAIRVLVRAAKGSRAPLRLLPGLVLNDPQGQPTATAEAVLRDAAPLPLA